MGVNYSDIGQRVKERRINVGMTQERLAELADLSDSYISGIETATTKLGLPAIVKIANALDISVDELLCGNIVRGKPILSGKFAELLADCTTEEFLLLYEITETMKKFIQKGRSY